MSVDHPQGKVKHHCVTSDAFLGGKLSVCQPEKGFRAGVDSVLLGAAVDDAPKTLLELGAGVGVASMTALTYCPGLTALLAEIDDEIVDLGKQNLRHNGYVDRAKYCQIDIMAPGPERVTAGMVQDHFDSVIANPPYFDEKTVSLPNDNYGKRAHAHGIDCLERWVKAAVSCARAGGEVIFIHRAAELQKLMKYYDRRLGNITILPIVSRPGQQASRVLVRGYKGSKAPCKLLSPLSLHGTEGRKFTPQLQAILMGNDKLHW
ncbi:tRNA(1)(Val) (adenine(37)-N(6))-methyltransferase [Maritalea myrionectae]|uniref:tRNA(1)(Val) (Adenine(37)-N(6))-methyltransferase n=1 Tax=Maritalea myrionectae TaxID=454601 RepID=A0A2R4MGQ2_9HYPH|nr:methyltransferase [Maritalea myrionectae]AVX05227.1 tRNA(1)(Val) (adenine(37)-N(6))-methyltransferase [Maritalea myrionectae]